MLTFALLDISRVSVLPSSCVTVQSGIRPMLPDLIIASLKPRKSDAKAAAVKSDASTAAISTCDDASAAAPFFRIKAVYCPHL